MTFPIAAAAAVRNLSRQAERDAQRPPILGTDFPANPKYGDIHIVGKTDYRAEFSGGGLSWVVQKTDNTLANNLMTLCSKLVPRKTTIEKTDPAYDQALGALKQYMSDMHAGFPQYLGIFEVCVLGRANHRLEFKGGSVVEAGDVVLVNPKSSLGSYLNSWDCSIYSPRSLYGLDTTVDTITIL